MKTKIIEVTQPNPKTNPQNWGKFLLGQLTEEEYSHQSEVSPGKLLPQIGYWHRDPMWLWVLDLQTREGAFFLVGGCAEYDLNEKHQIYVCPLFEPFLEWLYLNFNGNLDKLPSYVQIDAPVAFSGYRREGKDLDPKS
jgi:hypothetical protein